MSHPFGNLLSQFLHRKRGLSQAKLAAGILQSPSVISEMCKGQRLTGVQARERVLQIIEWLHAQAVVETNGDANALLEAAGMAPLRQSDAVEAGLLRQLQSSPPSDLSPPSAPELQSHVSLYLEQGDLHAPAPAHATYAHPIFTTSAPAEEMVDWGEAPLYDAFFGRKEEVAQVGQWLVDGECRLVMLLGMGGVGKTSLAVQVVNAVLRGERRFERVLWRSLLNAPPLGELLQQAIPYLSNQKVPVLPDSMGERLRILVQVLRQQRGLLILDNLESILQPRARGAYRPGYEGYGQLFQLLAQSDHRSCVLVTSREQPNDLLNLAVASPRVRSLQLTGLAIEASQALLEARGLHWQQEENTHLVERYSGHPLALKVVAETIQEIYGGDVAAFLNEEVLIFDDVRDVLDQQFSRLSTLEQELLLWMAVEREPVSPQVLWENLVQPPLRRTFLEALRSLMRRSLVEVRATAGKKERNLGDEAAPLLGLQNVVTEYLTDHLLATVYQELETGQLSYFSRHALVKAQAKIYLRESQVRILLAPLVERLMRTLGREGAKAHLRSALARLPRTPPRQPSYAAGNILNLLVHLQSDLRGWDFSQLAVWQAYLANVQAQEVSLSHADLSHSVFRDELRRITSLAFSPDGERLAVAIDDGEIRLWSIKENRVVLSWAPYGRIRSICYHPAGNILACGEIDKVRLRDAHSGKSLATLIGHTKRIIFVCFSPDGRILATCAFDHTVRLWQVDTGQCLATIQVNDVSCIAFSPNSSLLASGSYDGTIRLWDVTCMKCITTLQASKMVSCVSFSPNSSLLASGSEDGTARLWDITSGECQRNLRGHIGQVWVSFRFDGRILASCSLDGTIRLWDVYSGLCVHTLLEHGSSGVELVLFSPDSTTLASISSTLPIMRLWDSSSGRCLSMLEGYSGAIEQVIFTPDRKTMVSIGNDAITRLWELHNNTCRQMQHSDFPQSLGAFIGQDEKLLLVHSGSGGLIRVSSADDGSTLCIMQGHTDTITDIAFSPDGMLLASCSWDDSVRLWDAHSGHCLQILKGFTKWKNSVCFSPDGVTLAGGGGDHTVTLWNVQSGRCLHTLKAHNDEVMHVGFSPDGTALISGDNDGSVHLWDVASGQLRLTVSGDTHWLMTNIGFSPNRQIFTTATDDGIIHLWDVTSGRCIYRLHGHTDAVGAICFAPDGDVIASASDDHTIRLWNVASGTCIHTLHGHTDKVRTIDFSTDGKLLGSGSSDKSSKIWDVQSGACLATLSDRPYERMNITAAIGLTEAQKAALRALGAVEEPYLYRA